MNEPSSPRHHFRSGTAARLAGLPVTTLRVWERRYGVVAAQKSAGGQRVYSPRDVSRLKLLRELTQSGHPIGTIATLGLDALHALLSGEAPPADVAPSAQPDVDVVVVGREVAPAFEALRGCTLRAVYDDLERAEAASIDVRGAKGALLLVRVVSLQPGAVDRVLALAASMHARATFVLYGFGTRASIRSLREAGATARREPLSEGELAQWVHGAARSAPAARSNTQLYVDAGALVAPRAFSDEQLARLATLPSPVACECLRHMAEIVSQLAGFERYSRECISTGPADAALHRQLSRTAGAARTLFELALQRVVDEERLVVSDGPA